MRSLIACSAAIAALIAASHASADPTAAERGAAETLFKEAKKLMARGKVPEACAKFAASYKIDAAGGTLLNLAMCHEVEGKTATAWTEFSEALSLAKKSGRADRQKAATAHIVALEPRMSRLLLRPPALPGLTLLIDGAPIPAAAIGTAIPVDPGDHVASATAPGRRPWERKITFKEGQREDIAVPELEPLEAPPPPPPPSVSWKLPLGIAAASAGAILLGVGTGFGVRAVALGGTVSAECPKGSCSPAGWDALASGRAAARVSNGTLIAGGVAALAGGGLIIAAILGAPASDAAPRARLPLDLEPSVGPGFGLLTLRGAF